MSNIMDIIANETHGKSYRTFKYSFEGKNSYIIFIEKFQLICRQFFWQLYNVLLCSFLLSSPPVNTINLSGSRLLFLSNMKNNFRGKTLRLFFYSLVNEETHKTLKFVFFNCFD